MNSLEKYKKVFCDTFGISDELLDESLIGSTTTVSLLDESFTFKAVPQWDSVVHLSLISNLEDAFDIMFDAQDILHYGSYLNGIEILKKYGVKFD